MPADIPKPVSLYLGDVPDKTQQRQRGRRYGPLGQLRTGQSRALQQQRPPPEVQEALQHRAFGTYDGLVGSDNVGDYPDHRAIVLAPAPRGHQFAGCTIAATLHGVQPNARTALISVWSCVRDRCLPRCS
jgi:hypothetical protein